MDTCVVGYEKQPALCFPNVQAAFSAQSVCSSGTANGLASRRMYLSGWLLTSNHSKPG